MVELLLLFSHSLCLTLCDNMDCSTPGLPVHHLLPKFTQAHVPWDGDAIPPSHPLSSPSPPALNLSEHQGIFQWVNSLLFRWPNYWSFNFSISPSNEIQGWFLLVLTGLISLLYKGPSRVFSSTTIWNHWIYASKFKVWIVSLLELWLHLL